jgi:hypothetical protein
VELGGLEPPTSWVRFAWRARHGALIFGFAQGNRDIYGTLVKPKMASICARYRGVWAQRWGSCPMDFRLELVARQVA